MERALFSALTGSASALLAPAEGVNVEELDPNVLWVVRVGEPVVTGLGPATITGPGYSIHSRLRDSLVSPRSDQTLSFSDECKGPADANWVCGASSIITYASTKGGGTKVDLLLEVSELGAGGEIEFILGQTVLKGQLPVGTYALALEFPLESNGGEMIIRAAAGSPAAVTLDGKFVRVVSINAR
jgi:hypothetical protein